MRRVGSNAVWCLFHPDGWRGTVWKENPKYLNFKLSFCFWAIPQIPEAANLFLVQKSLCRFPYIANPTEVPMLLLIAQPSGYQRLKNLSKTFSDFQLPEVLNVQNPELTEDKYIYSRFHFKQHVKETSGILWASFLGTTHSWRFPNNITAYYSQKRGSCGEASCKDPLPKYPFLLVPARVVFSRTALQEKGILRQRCPYVCLAAGSRLGCLS